MILLDLFINHRRLKLFEIFLIVSLTCSVALTFVGDKLWSEEEYLSQVHHRDNHIFHYKNGRLFRLDSENSEVSNENENSKEKEEEFGNAVINLNEKVHDNKIKEKSDHDNKKSKNLNVDTEQI
jgi:hypothetical protein